MKSRVRLNMAQSLDGHIIQPDGHWSLGSREDKRRMDRLRRWADAVVVSARSMRADDPELIIRGEPASGRHPVPVVVFHQPPEKNFFKLRIFSSPHPKGILITTSTADGSRDEEVQQQTGWQVCRFRDMAEMSAYLRERFRRILLEGGGSLNGLFLREGFIDEIHFTLVPHVWAGQSPDRIFTSTDFLSPVRCRLVSAERRGDEMFFRYLILKDDATRTEKSDG